jgi:predicted RNase H-like nuclease (RuvC/YqgF family)
MSYGMSYHQFWDGDVYAHREYRRAHKLKLQEKNTEMWLQGRYIYDALCAVAPIVRAFSKASRPGKYADKPYDLFEEERKKREEEEAKRRYEKMREKVAAFAEEFNKMRKKTPEGKEVGKDA